MGRFEPGNPKPPSSGRKRGSPNKKTLGLEGELKRLGLNVVEQLAEALAQLDVERRAQVLVHLMGYLYPKRKAIEQRIEIDAPPEKPALSSEELRNRLARHNRVRAELAEDPVLSAAFATIAQHYESPLSASN